MVGENLEGWISGVDGQGLHNRGSSLAAALEIFAGSRRPKEDTFDGICSIVFFLEKEKRRKRTTYLLEVETKILIWDNRWLWDAVDDGGVQ
ncbi:unnamed protein product [Enterobius vermicularis]|uniref:PPM-type phosphatase domain-containing protein n=1 Tax=Enterobius vermicularis TaxID=51028 RepID=A0A0N4VJ47_ENTVE|nr:unnamed protein product [Enterobius vermicularis]